MGSLLIQTDDLLPVADRCAQWRHQALVQPVPVELRIDRPCEFSASLTARDVGVLNVTVLANRSNLPYLADRTRAMIYRSDPEAYRLVVNLRGSYQASQCALDASLRSGDLALYDTSLPFQVWRGGRESPVPVSDAWVMVTFPHEVLPLPPRSVRQLLGGRLSGQTGIGAMVSTLARRIARDGDGSSASCLFHLSTAFIDLLAALFAQELDEPDTVPPESGRRALLLQIQAFIERRLGDPELGPDMLAAAHHISIRSLHRVFNASGLTVSSWIRDRRLDHCRRDMVDPSQATRPISTIASRWGFPDQANFSRVFRRVYGLSPTDYRRQALIEATSGVRPGRTEPPSPAIAQPR